MNVVTTPTGCEQTVTFGTTGARTVRVTTQDSDGATTAKTLSLTVQPPPANPYPRITSTSLNSWELKSSGGANFCVVQGVANGSSIDLRNPSCEPSTPWRYFAGAEVENPDNEALSYSWKLYRTVNGVEQLLDTGNQPKFVLVPTPNGNNAAPGTTPCRLTLTVSSVADPSRSDSRAVWQGQCTYFTVRAA